MESLVKTYRYPDGQIQRVQLVRLDDWGTLEFLKPQPDGSAFACFCNIYRRYLVPACPWIFGQMVMFQLPEQISLPMDAGKYGRTSEALIAAAAILRRGVKLVAGKPVFFTPAAKELWKTLEKENCLQIVSGKLPITTIIPVGREPGYLSDCCPDAEMKVNASFFIMDRFDCATVYDHVGTPFGLCVKDGYVTRPPLYSREALLVDQEGKVSVQPMDIRMLVIEIGGKLYIHGKNATIYTRPRHSRTLAGKKQALVIIGDRVAAVGSGRLRIPASGFVLCPETVQPISPGDKVLYHGLEHIRFGIQVGNSILKDGHKTEAFLSPFYNIRRLEPVPYPPSLYPMDFAHARAARIALGADKAGKPILLWAEGAAKFGYVPGKGSCGASLSEMAEICADVGMENAVNLDGGGSAQILLNNQRYLEISDRNADDHTEAERPIPFALIVK